MQKTNRTFFLLACVLIAAAIIGGFYLLGTPGRQRSLAEDNQRVQDMLSIANSVNNHARYLARQAGASSTAPDSLAELTNTGTVSLLPKDPVTKIDYEYRKLNGLEYELCAVFAMESEAAGDDQSGLRHIGYYGNGKFWEHPAGRHCFRLSVMKNPYDGSIIYWE